MVVAVTDQTTAGENASVLQRGCKQQAMVSDPVFEKKNSPNKRIKETEKFRDKVFIPRNSLITELLENEHFRAIQHFFIAATILLFLNEVLRDSIECGKLSWNPEILFNAFGQFHKVLLLWLLMKSSSMVIVYLGFRQWASGSQANERIWNVTWLLLYFAYLGMFVYFPLNLTYEHNLPPASSAIIVMEQVRLVMKTHAFVRSNYDKVMDCGEVSGSKPALKAANSCPEFSKYVYFLFAPTLVYRDQYPRYSHIRWNYVASNMGQFFGAFFWLYVIMKRHAIPTCSKIGKEPLPSEFLILLIFESMIYGMLIVVWIFFAFFHCWLNAFAEMLRFSDRHFYEDWWNSCSFSEFYKKWNVFIHDWLYCYVYKDVYQMTSSRTWAVTAVFVTSMLAHDYCTTHSTKTFAFGLYVFLTVATVLSTLYNSKKKSRKRNVFLWIGLFVVFSVSASSITLESWARPNCPSKYEEWYLGCLVPRILSC